MQPEALVAAAAAAAAVALMMRPVAQTGRCAVRGWWWPAALVSAGGLLVATTPTVAALAVVAAGVAQAVRSLAAVRRRRRQAARTADRVVETCELIAAELAAGQSPLVALRRAAAEWPALAPAAEAGELGGDQATALADIASRPGAQDLRLVAAAWAVAHRTGSGLADTLDRVAVAIRGRRATRRVVESELASARATARLVAALPLVMLLLGSGDGAPWRFLFGHPLGLGCLVLGLAFGGVGLWWIERIADEVTR
jgi:tight adherence protein B